MSQTLSQRLGYEFRDPQLLKLAVSHRSAGGESNERLEFLGDAVVNFIIGEALYRKFPDAQEGELSRWRATLINRETLGQLARRFELGKDVRLGPGEVKSGGSERQSILSCTMEAVIGAIYLDSGFAVCNRCVLTWYAPLLASLSSAASHKDPKTVLQEYLQAHKLPLPIYQVDTIAGDAHQQIFVVSCAVTGQIKVIGKGTSRRRAEQEAAVAMLEVIKP